MKKYLTPFNVLKCAFIALICAALIAPAYSYGADKFKAKVSDIKVEKSIMGNNSSPWSFTGGESASDVDTLTDYKAAGSNTVAIPFSMLYGSWFKSSSYTGEGNRNNSKTTKAPYEQSSSTVNGWNRLWVQGKNSQNGGSEGTFKDLWGESMLSDSADDGEIDDLHMYNICNPANTQGFLFVPNTLIAYVMSWFHGLNTGICNMFINVANFDVADVANKIGMKDMNNKISQMLLSNNSALSPLMVIAVMAFIFGLVGIVLGYFRGGSISIKNLITEVAFLALACICFNMANTGGLYSMQSSLTSAITAATNSVSIEGSDTAVLFNSSSGDGLRDTKNTQMATLQKPYIDAVIRAQFKTSISELDMDNSKWGGVDVNGINWSLVDNTSVEAITVSTGNKYTTHNIGYYWYACSSGLNPNYPYQTSKDNITFNRSGNSGVGFIPDFLAAVNHKGGVEVGQKCTAIMQALNTKSEPSALLGLIDLLEILMVGTIASLCIYNLTSKLIFGIGIIAFPILPILLLIKNTRSLAKQLLMTWVNALIKIALASAMISFVIAMTAKLVDSDNGGFLGIILAGVFLIVMFKAIPAVMSYLTRMLSRLGGGQLQAADSMDRWFDKNMFQKQAHALQGHGLARKANEKRKSLDTAAFSKEQRKKKRDALEDKLTHHSENVAKENAENHDILNDENNHVFDNILKEQEGANDITSQREFDEDGNELPQNKSNLDIAHEMDAVLSNKDNYDQDSGLLSKKFLGLEEDVSKEEWEQKSVEKLNNMRSGLSAGMYGAIMAKNGGKMLIDDGKGGFVSKQMDSRELNKLIEGNTAKKNLVSYKDTLPTEEQLKGVKKACKATPWGGAKYAIEQRVGELGKTKEKAGYKVNAVLHDNLSKLSDWRGDFDKADEHADKVKENMEKFNEPKTSVLEDIQKQREDKENSTMTAEEIKKNLNLNTEKHNDEIKKKRDEREKKNETIRVAGKEMADTLLSSKRETQKATRKMAQAVVNDSRATDNIAKSIIDQLVNGQGEGTGGGNDGSGGGGEGTGGGRETGGGERKEERRREGPNPN